MLKPAAGPISSIQQEDSVVAGGRRIDRLPLTSRSRGAVNNCGAAQHFVVIRVTARLATATLIESRASLLKLLLV